MRLVGLTYHLGDALITQRKFCNRKILMIIVHDPVHQVVELVLLNIGRILIANHPMHLHGHHFRVVGWGKLGRTTTLAEFQRYEDEGRIPLKLSRAPRLVFGCNALLALVCSNVMVYFVCVECFSVIRSVGAAYITQGLGQ